MRRLATVAAALLGSAALVAIGFWAGKTALVPPEVPFVTHAAQSYTVSQGSVGRVVQVSVTAVWSTQATVVGGVDGVVTAVGHQPGAFAAAGEVVATVNLRPIVVAEGATPMFRSMRRGDRGPDVRQLQSLLRGLGLLRRAPTGSFDSATVAAVMAWQRSMGAEADGTVGMGTVLFVPTLPARLTVLPRVGGRAAPGMEFASVLASRPTFAARLDSPQQDGLVLGAMVEVAAPGGESWIGSVGAVKPAGDGTVTVTLTGTLCGESCADIPLDGTSLLTGTVVVVPERHGVVVPVSALILTPSGRVAVGLPDGTRREVDVAAQANGFALVEGLPPGTPILLPTETAP